MLRVAFALAALLFGAPLTGALLFGALTFQAEPAFAQSGRACPAGYAENRAEAAKLKAALKRKLADLGVPPRLQKLVDGLPDCRACIEAAGERVSLIIEYSVEEFQRIYGTGGSSLVSNRATGDGRVIVSLAWSPRDEQRARNDLRKGSTRAFHIVIGQLPCQCCPKDADSTRQPGYDAALQAVITPGNAASFRSPDALGPEPRDLTELDPTSRRMPCGRSVARSAIPGRRSCGSRRHDAPHAARWPRGAMPPQKNSTTCASATWS
jgi:hypothetical protein